MKVDFTAMDAVVLDLVVSLATAKKEDEDLFRGVLEVGLPR